MMRAPAILRPFDEEPALTFAIGTALAGYQAAAFAGAVLAIVGAVALWRMNARRA